MDRYEIVSCISAFFLTLIGKSWQNRQWMSFPVIRSSSCPGNSPIRVKFTVYKPANKLVTRGENLEKNSNVFK